jgi:hypothetical protein
MRFTMTEHPAGWHPDPRGRHEHRYWDGSQWTDHVSDKGEQSQDPFAAEEAKEVQAPIGPSMVNLPAIDPSLLAQLSAQHAEPKPEPAAAGHREQAGPEDALEKASDALDNAAASMAHKPLSLAALLSVAVPGTGHLYLGAQGAKQTMAYILVGASVVALVLSAFISWPIGLLVYLAAAGFALFDLKDELSPAAEQRTAGGPLAFFSDLGSALSWRLVTVAGVLLAISVFLPWYRVSVEGFTATTSGWDQLELIRFILLAVGIGGAVLGVLNIQQGTPGRPVGGQMGTIIAAAAAVAFVCVVFRLLIVPGGGLEFSIERSFGALLAFASSVLLVGGAAGAATAKS